MIVLRSISSKKGDMNRNKYMENQRKAMGINREK